MSTFCQRYYHKKCQRRGLGDQEKPKSCQRSLWTAPYQTSMLFMNASRALNESAAYLADFFSDLHYGGHGHSINNCTSMQHDPCYKGGLISETLCTNVQFITYSKCSNWGRISKLSSNFGSLFTFCYSAWGNQIKTKLQTCNLRTGQFISYKYVSQFWLSLTHPSSKK